ncbi:DUF6090 family protein [Psychroserpens sp. MEBiC05023]
MIKFFRRIRQQLLSENKFSKYLIYAIGEIILVVIGILIALQINTWNDLRQKDKLKQAYSKSLISNLKQDSTVLRRFLKATEQDFNQTLNHFKRVNSKTLNVDSLIIIARYEFKQITSVFTNSFNNQTFKTLIASGNIELFDEDISNDLMELNSLHEQFNLSIEKHNDNYIRQLSKYAESYPLIAEVPQVESPVQKLMWSNINKKEFSSLFTSVATFKIVLEQNGRRYSSLILDKTIQLLENLRTQNINNND